MQKTWTDEAWGDYLCWQSRDRKIVGRINQLLKDIDRSPYEGIGKPEPLKYDLQRYWSRRITAEHRLVYRVENDHIVVISCRTHYA